MLIYNFPVWIWVFAVYDECQFSSIGTRVHNFTFMLEQPPANEELHLELISNSWKRQNHQKVWWISLTFPAYETSGFLIQCLLFFIRNLFGASISLADVVNKKRIYNQYTVQSNDSLDPKFLYVELQWRTSDD